MALPAGYSRTRLSDIWVILDTDGQIAGFMDDDGTESAVPRWGRDANKQITSLVDGAGNTYELPLDLIQRMKRYGGRPIVTFNSIADVNGSFSAAGAGGSYGVDTTYKKYSAAPMKLVPGPAAAQTRITVDLTAVQTSNLQQFLQESPDMVVGILLYVPSVQPYSTFQMYLTNQSNRIANAWNSLGTFNLAGLTRPGWWFMSLVGQRYGHLELNGLLQLGFNVDNTGAQNNLLDSTTNFTNSIRIQLSSQANDNIGTSPIYIDSVWAMPRAKPICMLQFDDGYISQFTEGLEYCARKGIVGTIAVTKTLIDTTGYMTTAQLDAAYKAGWDLVNHANTHINANTKSANAICLSQTPGGAGNLTLNGATGSATFDAPRCITLTPAANEAGTPFTVTGLDEFGNAQTDVLWGKNAVASTSETVWTKVTQISVPAATVGAITVGTTLSYAEQYAEFKTCQDWLIQSGWTRGAYLAVYPNGTSNVLTDRAMSALGITYCRNVVGVYNYQYPHISGFQASQIAGYGGGGSGQAAIAYGVAAKYNTGNPTWTGPTFTATNTPFVNWTVTMTTATAFTVTDNDGRFIGTGTLGVAFSATFPRSPNEPATYTVGFTLTAGGTACVAGDAFKVAVTTLPLIVEQELVRRRATGAVYFHNLIRSGAQTSVDTFVSDFRMFVDQLAKDVAAGNVSALTMSQYAAYATRIAA